MSVLRVLLIAAETAETEYICSVLSEADHSVVPVGTLQEGSEALLIQKFDAVLIAPGIPAEAVDEFTGGLRQAEREQRKGARTPVVSLLPGNSQSASTSGGKGSVDAYLPEHFEAAVFARTVENLAHAVAQPSENSPAPEPDLPIFDVAEFEAQVAYDRDLMIEIIDLFLAERASNLAEMAESLAAGNLDKLMRSAHTIKGSLGSLHAHLARHRSQQLEMAAKSGSQGTCITLLAALEQDLNHLEPQLLSLRASAECAK